MNRAAKANGKKGLPKSKSGLKKKKSQRSLKVWPAANNGDEWDEGMPGHWYADADGNEWWDAEGEPSYYWDPSGSYEYSGDWAIGEGGLAEPVLSRRKRGKQSEKASSSKGPENPKPKKSAKAKAVKAKAKPGRKAVAEDDEEEPAGAPGDESVATPKPSRKKAKVAKRKDTSESAADARPATAATASKPQIRKDYDDIDTVQTWVKSIECDGDDTTLKTQVRAFLPPFKGSTRLNIYWTRYSCGVTLHYKKEDGSNAKTDVGFFSFSKCNAGLCHAVACGRFMAHEL